MIKEYLGIFLVCVVSIIYLFLVCNYVINPEDFSNLKLNEKGDLLAGIFSPLAFLWLVYGYLQQGRELKINSESLRLQANELKNSVEEQKKLIKLHEADQKNRFEQAKPILNFENLRFDPNQVEMVIADPFTQEPGYEQKQQDVSFQLKNLGASIKEVKIFRSENLLKNIKLLEKGAKEFFVFFLTDEEQENLLKNAMLELKFTLSYLDMFGMEHSEVYAIRLDDREEDDEGMYYYACQIRKSQ